MPHPATPRWPPAGDSGDNLVAPRTLHDFSVRDQVAAVKMLVAEAGRADVHRCLHCVYPTGVPAPGNHQEHGPPLPSTTEGIVSAALKRRRGKWRTITARAVSTTVNKGYPSALLMLSQAKIWDTATHHTRDLRDAGAGGDCVVPPPDHRIEHLATGSMWSTPQK